MGLHSCYCFLLACLNFMCFTYWVLLIYAKSKWWLIRHWIAMPR
jgi:hypothetical protein